MIRMTYPEFNFKTKEEAGKRFIFDSLRKSWLKLTNEEWVRQNFIGYLTEQMNYPASLIAQEKKITLGELNKRFDILVYDSSHRPWMMVECKAMEISLTPEVLNQVLRYNISVPVEYLVITNGSFAMLFHKQEGRLDAIEHFPVHA